MGRDKLRGKTGCLVCKYPPSLPKTPSPSTEVHADGRCVPGRKRKVKCGEERPACRNCAAFGRLCSWPTPTDLYDRRYRSRARSNSSGGGTDTSEDDRVQGLSEPDCAALVSISPSQPRALSRLDVEQELIHHFFDYWFSIIILPSVSQAYIIQSRAELVDMMHGCQSLRHAVLAGSASNKHMLMGDSRYQKTALRYYSKAVHELNKTLSEFKPGSKAPDFSLLSTVIFLYVYDVCGDSPLSGFLALVQYLTILVFD